MLVTLDRLSSILFIVCALVVGPVLLLALWAHAIILELWHRLNRPSKASGRSDQRLRGTLPMRPL
jgi:hypothetical protein